MQKDREILGPGKKTKKLSRMGVKGLFAWNGP